MKTHTPFHTLKLLFAGLISIFATIHAFADTKPGAVNPITNYGKMPLRFEANDGQTAPGVRYISRGDGYTMYFTPTQIALALDVNSPATVSNAHDSASSLLAHLQREQVGLVHINLLGANSHAVISSEQTLPEKINYFIGNDQSKWRRNVPVFGRVCYQAIYPGIDLKFYGNQSHLEYDFVIAPQADPQQIKLQLSGADKVKIEANGDLAFSVQGRATRFHRPVVYQSIAGVRHDIDGRYRLNGDTVSFEVGAYDKTQPLVIDPVLSYSTFLGGTKFDNATSVAVDSAGNAYLCGSTMSVLTNLFTPGAFQTNKMSGTSGFAAYDCYVAKINSDGTQLDYLTYLGSSSADWPTAITINQTGEAYVTGETYYNDFPVTTNAMYPVNHAYYYSPINSYAAQGFITRLNTNGTQLVYSTYFGGTLGTIPWTITLGSHDNIYVGGEAYYDFPVTNAVQPSNSLLPGGTYPPQDPYSDDWYDGFVSEITSNGASLLFSTYYGGVHEDVVSHIALDSQTNLYAVGYTVSSDFPVTNAFQTTQHGARDAFAFKLGPGGTNIIYSTYMGGSGDDLAYGLDVDTNGNAYIVGGTLSSGFPITTNALQTTINGNGNTSSSDGFLTKLSSSGALLYSTFLGGDKTDLANAVKLQADGEIVIVGQTGSINFAPYANYGSVNSGNLDAFVAKISNDGQILQNFAYLGGSQMDTATSVALDSQNNAYIVGSTASSDFPITITNVVDPTYYGQTDAFIVKLYFEPNQLGTKVYTTWQDSNGWHVVGPPATLAPSNTWSAISQIPSVSSNGVTSLATERFQRGASYDPTFTSFVIPLSQQTGFRLDDTGDNSETYTNRPWFARLQNSTQSHLSLVASTNGSGVVSNYYGYVTNFNNPIAAFGDTAGGSPLYINEQFQFGVYCGAQYESTNSNGAIFASPLRILVYNLSSFVAGQTNLVAPIATNYITIPRRTIAADATNWFKFSTNGFALTIETNGLRTTVQLVSENGGAWGVVPEFTNAQSATYLITEECTTNKNYGYVFEGIGTVPLSTNLYPMVTNSAAGVGWDRLFSFNFETRPPWRSVFIDQPQFNGTPMPSFYQGASLEELTNMNAVVTNTVDLSAAVYTNLDDSPELRRHPTLDNLVASMNNDPIALANYVVNNIELTDALAYNENNGQASAPSVSEGGVNRSALDTYLEGEGSPVEQCALLVYLLRQAGYPAAYEFPTNNNVQMQDTRLSALLRMQLHGAVNQFGRLFTTNMLITVNYPWVVTTISNKTVHIFPWLKDTQITEGLNLYDYMPTNYDTGFKWLQRYLYGDTNILGLSQESDAPSVLFPRFVKQQLLASAPGVSLDDIGTRAFNRQHYYARWQDFPTPTVVNNPSQAVCVDSLTSITNVLPSMTNLFNTVTLTIYSQNDTNTQMTVGPLRMADLHNREMFMATNGANGLMLWLAPYIPGNTNESAFDATDPALTNIQVKTLTISTNDTTFAIRFTHERHQAIDFTPTNQYLDVSETLQFSPPDRPFNRDDITAICFNVGRVTPAMIDVHAQAFQQMAYQWSLDTNSTPAVQDYQGAAAYMMGMDYYSHVSQFLPVCEQLHKTQVISWYAEGLSRLTPVQLGVKNFMRPSMDMFYSEMAHAGNGTSHPDSGNDPLAGTDDFSSIMDGEIAAQEHSIINGYYQSPNAVSSVVLLRLAQQRATNGVSGIIELNKNNYQTVGATNAPGYGPTALENCDPNIWSAVTNAFSGWDGDYVRAYITPGPVSMQAADYRGMGLVIVGKSQSASIISVNMNGVLGQPSAYFGDTPAALSTAYSANSFSASSLDASSSYGSYYNGGDLYYGGSPYGSSGFDYYWDTPSWFGSSSYWPYIPSVRQYQVTATFTPPSQIDLSQQINDLYHFSQSTPVTTSLTHALDSGNTGSTVWHNLLNYVYDPVNVMSGEFYHDTVDLTLAGPMPFQLRRNYSSQNQDDRNGFGYGWDINVVPYLGVATTTNATTNIVLTAVNLDGSVIAYRQQAGNTNLYLPATGDNLELDNDGGGHIGSIHNPFNGKIVHSVVGTNDVYTLTQPDGQTRTYVVNSFPVDTPTNTVSRERPYLTLWQDTEGNSWTFVYGTNSTLPSYGSVTRVDCSNGNYLGLDYNAGGYVIDAYTSDGESTSYQYDDFGDLVRAVRPDKSEETYEYKHIQYTNSGTIYVDSTHLLIKEFKPDGRTLQNNYDTNRRVVAQLATVGPDLNLYTNATFIYSNNFALTGMTNGISGYTLVKDVNGKTNRFDYANSLVTTNTDQLGQKVIQVWYADSATAPGYPRSLYQTRDKRGLWTQFQYDSQGNVTNSFSWGDLTGDGSTQYATNTAAYNTNNLPTLVTDPVGNSVQTVYDPQYSHLPQYVVYSAGGTPTVTNEFSYENVTNVVVNGTLTLTNMAFGMLEQQIRAANSSDAATNQWTFDGRGFLTMQVEFTGTGDPAVTNYFTCNNQGEVIERTDAAGQRVDFGFDAMRRPISHEVFAAGASQPMFWENLYRNDNGQPVWYNGPRYNPEDYQWSDYDGMGRLITHIRWRSEGKPDGTGVEAPTGYNLYAQSFYQYDKFGNLTLSVDPRGAETTNTWDAIGQLVQTKHLDTNGTTVLSSDGFAYEPGGLVKYHTNALGGVTTTLYTTTGLPEYRATPDGATNGWRYYLDGRIKREIQRNGAYWETTYNDADRITTRTFYSASGTALATNSFQLDRRGNVINRTDEGGNTFVSTFDGLDRVKMAYGPEIVTISLGGGSGQMPATNDVYVTNIVQQVVANYFDAAGQVVTNVNALDEGRVTRFDALGRITQQQIFNADGTLVRQTGIGYAPDFNSVAVTNGSGANAIVHTTYTDNDGQNVLSIGYPSGTEKEFMLRQFDLAGNLIAEQHDSSTSGSVTTWTTASFGYDNLNRLINKTDRDGAFTSYGYDAMDDLTNQTLPSSVVWRATYNNAGQRLKDWNQSGTSGTRTNTYTYFASGSPFAGLLQSMVDGRKTTNSYSYDDWLRVTNQACTGSLPEQDLTTTWQYEPRGFATNVTEQFASTTTGPDTSIERSFDAYGQMSSESVNAGSYAASASQGWDAAGRRVLLGMGNSYGFSWQADGTLAAVSDSTGTASYGYDLAGMLTNRIVGNRMTSITSRDGEGRPLGITTTVNLASELTESLSWSGDGLLSADTLERGDFTDSRSYAYADLSRRLTEEQLNLNASTTWTNSFVFDHGATGGPGVLTSAGQTSALWTGGADAFSRVTAETNNVFNYSAYGHVNGQATLYGWLDGLPVPVVATGTNAMQWQAAVELSSGSHELKVAALHPSGFYTAWATNYFTNNIAHEAATVSFDYAGYITNRVWKNPSGTVERTQSLSWDAKGRLLQVIDRDSSNNGQNFTVVYDALGRRLQTTQVLVTNGVALTNFPVVVNHYFDPLYEFQELGVTEGTKTTWKLMGPDLDGQYGGENGTGGFEASSPYLSLFNPTISDFNGNILGSVTNGSVSWNSSRVTAYGSVPNYRPPTLGGSGTLSEKYAWRDRATESIGLVWLGANWYDPVSGHFMSADPLGYDANTSLYGFCGGNPLGYWDADGRFGKQLYHTTARQATTAAAWVDDTVINMVVGTDALLNRAAGVGMDVLGGDPNYFYEQADNAQRLMSPYARRGYYNPNTPTAQLATASTIFVAPQTIPARVGTLESVVMRDVVATTTRETAEVADTTAVQSSAVNNFRLMLPAPRQPVALLPEHVSEFSSADRTFAAQNIRQARQILRDTRLDLSIGERNQIIRGFDLETFRVRTLESEVTDYRYFDGVNALLGGRWSTSQWIIAPADRISILALPNNAATRAATVRLQSGTTVFEGTVAPQLKYGLNLTGGGFQRYNAAGPRAAIEEIP